jgi:hypothetical protein
MRGVSYYSATILSMHHAEYKADEYDGPTY